VVILPGDTNLEIRYVEWAKKAFVGRFSTFRATTNTTAAITVSQAAKQSLTLQGIAICF